MTTDPAGAAALQPAPRKGPPRKAPEEPPEEHRAPRISQGEFIALMAMLTATVAFSIDAMLPAMTEIGREISPGNINRAQLIITSFVLGMGLGTLVAGPLSDAFGRRRIMAGGALLYSAAAALAYAAPTLELMLAARVLQGLGAAGPRVAALAMTRDLYAGRGMARIVSLIMVVFTLVPAFAPAMGAGIIALFGWRGIFAAFICFSMLSLAWLLIRQPETLPPERRRPVRLEQLRSAAIEVARNRTTTLSIAVQTLVFGIIFSVLSTAQLVFDQVFDLAHSFHLWFGGIALFSGSSGVLNARLVERLGMRAMIKGVLTSQVLLSAAMLVVWWAGPPQPLLLWAYVIWTASVFFMAGMTIGNLNALGLEPMGHIAGTAASLMAAIPTMGAVLLSVPIGQSFDGTPVPIAFAICLCALVARLLTGRIQRDAG